MVKRWLSRVCLKASGKFASLAFKLSDESPLKTAVSASSRTPDGDITTGMKLSSEAVAMRADLHSSPKPVNAEEQKPLAGSIEERTQTKW